MNDDRVPHIVKVAARHGRLLEEIYGSKRDLPVLDGLGLLLRPELRSWSQKHNDPALRECTHRSPLLHRGWRILQDDFQVGISLEQSERGMAVAATNVAQGRSLR